MFHGVNTIFHDVNTIFHGVNTIFHGVNTIFHGVNWRLHLSAENLSLRFSEVFPSLFPTFLLKHLEVRSVLFIFVDGIPSSIYYDTAGFSPEHCFQ